MVSIRRHPRRWRTYFAFGMVIVGISGALLIWCLLVPPAPTVPLSRGVDQSPTEYIAGGQRCDPKKQAATAGNSRRSIEADDCVQAVEQHRLQQANLTQGLRAARAAEQGLIISQSQTRIAAVQAALLWLAFLAAVSAGEAAIRAARAADETLVHARKTSERELRAYVYLEIVNIQRQSRGKWIINFQFKNFGATPAHKVAIVWGCEIVQWDGEYPNHWPDYTDGDFFGSLAPADYLHFPLEVPGTVSIDELKSGKRAVCLDGKIYYETVFTDGNDLTDFKGTWFRYYAGGDEGLDLIELKTAAGAEMSAASSGNDAN
jgi:hypothetical protein